MDFQGVCLSKVKINSWFTVCAVWVVARVTMFSGISHLSSYHSAIVEYSYCVFMLCWRNSYIHTYKWCGDNRAQMIHSLCALRQLCWKFVQGLSHELTCCTPPMTAPSPRCSLRDMIVQRGGEQNRGQTLGHEHYTECGLMCHHNLGKATYAIKQSIKQFL